MPRKINTTRGIALTGALLAAIAASGCQGPCILPAAGPMDQQQATAVIHDPFPQNDIGPYEAASRPPGYQQPLPLPVRNRIAPDAFRMAQ
tara:strand:+ start:4556 stop:4825 length:270 start_codon:yes stop_codon:yes gene_type:complete